jgi:glycosyltransferase involved in cell wall biosynthesis
MDDWQSAIYRGGLLSVIERRRMRRLIATLVEAASLRLAIGDGMAREYSARFGRPFLPFQNTIDAARWSALAKRDLTPGEPLRLLYAGSVLGFAQADSLVACCEAVAALRRDGLAIALDIYSPPEQLAPLRARLACDEAIRLHDVIADDETYFRTLAAADILLLPVNFDPHSVRYIRLSMPTKVPSYLVSGTPVLVYGPAETTQVAYARDTGWGHVVDRPDPALLRAAIRRLASDRPLRETLSATARRVAADRHDAAVVRVGFQAALTAAGRRQ